jgi:hypothetical protein
VATRSEEAATTATAAAVSAASTRTATATGSASRNTRKSRTSDSNCHRTCVETILRDASTRDINGFKNELSINWFTINLERVDGVSGLSGLTVSGFLETSIIYYIEK